MKRYNDTARIKTMKINEDVTYQQIFSLPHQIQLPEEVNYTNLVRQ